MKSRDDYRAHTHTNKYTYTHNAPPPFQPPSLRGGGKKWVGDLFYFWYLAAVAAAAKVERTEKELLAVRAGGVQLVM